MRHSKKHSKKSSFIKDGNLKYLIPVIVLLIIAIASWSWLLLDFPGISDSVKPYVTKYLKGLMEAGQAGDNGNDIVDSGSVAGDIDDNKPDSSDDDSGSSATTNDKSSKTTEKDEKRPTIKLVIYDGPSYSSADDSCYYRIKAVVTGNPKPEVRFSRDDSNGTAGPDSTQVNIQRGTKTYTLTATASNEHGTVMDSMTLVWGCNSNPVISEIKLSSDIVYISKQYDISVMASDPDGNKIAYKWTVSGGTLDSDSTQSVKWSTPANPENYEVKVEVMDSIGAKTTKTIAVYVGSAQAPDTTAPQTSPPTTAAETTAPETTATTEPQLQSLNVSKKTDEGGYLEYGGQTYAGGNVYAGDSAGNKPCAGFISFDIGALEDKTIQTAKLTLRSATVYSKPLEFLDALWINIVSYGERPIVQGDFNLPGTAVQSFASPSITCSADKLKSELQKAINAGKSRFQVRIHFAGPYTDNDNAKDGWEYTTQNISLSVTY